ncbi:MAG: hypothetical protein ACK55I_00030, partial [bacterium]
ARAPMAGDGVGGRDRHHRDSRQRKSAGLPGQCQRHLGGEFRESRQAQVAGVPGEGGGHVGGERR